MSTMSSDPLTHPTDEQQFVLSLAVAVVVAAVGVYVAVVANDVLVGFVVWWTCLLLSL